MKFIPALWAVFTALSLLSLTGAATVATRMYQSRRATRVYRHRRTYQAERRRE